ncbi:phospholipase D family protein [Paenibacillus sp. Y412MC10]|uniref:phospholipase D family protein n=1 Tax=Geobacillus sp. (strain Y412MC10) TaxID=481743 RepID=UPI0011A980BC|nr:phospholipase D family protein [Paenibacillus sp. Y412MC10]
MTHHIPSQHAPEPYHSRTASWQPQGKSRKRRVRRWILAAACLLILWLAGVIVYQTHKPLPPGISYESPLYHVDQVRFYRDLTYPDNQGQVIHEPQITNRIMQIVDESREFLVIDLFLFNDYKHKGQKFPTVSKDLADKLIAHKKQYPQMQIVFITDQINTNYGSAPNPLLEAMKAAGIQVVVTDVDPLRDSNPIYSAVWRTFIQWFGQSGKGWIPNLMANEGPKVTARSYLKMLNVKANHRKVVVSEKTALVSSGNVHDASAYHSNIAFEVQGPIIGDILKGEQAAARLSGDYRLPVYTPASEDVKKSSEGKIAVRYLTEGKIDKYTLLEINRAPQGSTLWMGMFYLADEKVMSALLDAADRGVNIRLLLDPNQNAFGQDKIGIPNRPVAKELTKRSDGRIAIRWYNTTEEQYHTKLMYISNPSGSSVIMGGSTNLTPRNLDNYNLENDLWISVPRGDALDRQMAGYFNRLWNNRDGHYSLDLSAYQEKSTWFKDFLFRVQKLLGFTTF